MTSISRPEAADALEELLGVAPVDDEGVHALAGDAGGEHPPAGGAGHGGVLALGVDHVGGDAAGQAPQQGQLGGEGLARAGARQHRGVRVEVGAVEGVVDDGRAGPQVEAVERAAAGVQVRGREGEEPRKRRRVQGAPGGKGVQPQRDCRKKTLALPEGEGIHLA